MSRILAKWRAASVAIAIFKLFAAGLIPVAGDLMNWTKEASLVLKFLVAGQIQRLLAGGAYLGIQVLLAPFFWVWTILPIEHPALHNLASYSTPAILLALLMKLPIFLSDISCGILIARLVGKLTQSEGRRALGFLSWFANPFNFYYLYVFGAMDAIPAALVLLALSMGLNSRWARCGFTTTVAGLLRLYPFTALPFFFQLTKTRPARVNLIVASLLPLACLIALLFPTGAIASITSIPLKQYWLLEFLGGNIANGGQLLILAPVLILIQLYVVFRFWRADSNIVHLACVPFLALLLGASTYGGSSQHFLWVSPLLSASVALHPREAWIFALTFITAYLSPAVYPFSLPIFVQSRELLDNLLAGAFYAMKATYLTRLNLWNMKPIPNVVQK
jgi:hypothetical protein